jgi:hypothetical protein
VFLFVCAFFLSEGMFQIQSSGAELEPAQDLPALTQGSKNYSNKYKTIFKKDLFLFIYLAEPGLC